MKRAISSRQAWAIVLAVLLGLLLLPALASAQEPVGPTVNDVASELYCPLCSGLTVNVCDLEVCVDMRAEITERLEAGESPEQIKQYFAEQYGQKVLGKPSTQGFDIAAWALPFVVLLLVAVATGGWLRGRLSSHPLPTIPATVPPADEYAARLERELRRLDDQ